MYLVDTNVISAGSPSRQGEFRNLADWMEAHSDRLYISVVTVAEIEGGIAQLRRRGAASKARNLSEWSELVLHLYADRVLPVDPRVARAIGALSDEALAKGIAPGFADLAIAATAIMNRLTILTRNLKHFGPLSVPAHDPFASLPL